MFTYALSRFPSLIARVLMAFGFCYAFTWIVNNATGKLGEKYKFEIKTAKDIPQRLDDVKGIDEIKEEI